MNQVDVICNSNCLFLCNTVHHYTYFFKIHHALFYVFVYVICICKSLSSVLKDVHMKSVCMGGFTGRPSRAEEVKCTVVQDISAQ